jgi:hypothetical protein
VAAAAGVSVAAVAVAVEEAAVGGVNAI